MKELGSNPHAIIEIERPGFTDGRRTVLWDSWEHKGLFMDVSVELVTGESSQATWSFFDPNFKLIDSLGSPDGLPLTKARVYMGYGKDLGEPIFKGLLSEIQRDDGSTTFVAFDMGYKMKLLKRTGYKNKRDDMAILRDLAKRNGLKFEGPEKPLKLESHRAVMQDEMTDWEFAMERARDAGLVLFVRQDTLFAKYPAKVGAPVITLQNKKDFVLQSRFDFKYRTPENQEGRPNVVKARGRGKGGKRIEGRSDAGTRGRERIVLKQDAPGRATKSKLSKRAQAQKELDREHAFEAHLAIAFPPDGQRLDARNTVRIEGIGQLFSGDYICDAAHFQLSNGGMGISLDLYRDAKI